MQRTKGAVGERELAELFSNALGQVFKRNIGQARDGGNDLDVGPLVVEVKRRKTLITLRNWYKQAVSAAIRRDADPNAPLREHGPSTPVVVAREDGGSWLVVLSLNDFLRLTRREIKRQLGMPEV